MLNRLEVDQAVFFAIAARGWQFVAGPVTIVLIGTYFSGEVQGYYYTFWSLIALQTVFDFSFQQVIVNFASHEWGRLSGGSLAGKPGDEVAAGQAVGRAVGKDGGGSPGDSRLASLLRGSLGWYAIAAAAFFVVVGPAGIWFLGSGASSERITWKPGWWALVALTAVNFWTTPFLAVLEGCGRVRSIYQLQFARSFVGNWVVWLMIPLGAGLWVPAGAAAVRLLCEAIWIAGFHRRFFWRFLRRPVGEGVDWFGEIWPFQWRVGVRGLLGMLNTLLINPVVFYYQGEVAAGRFGMTWQVLTSLQAACMSWIKTRTAQFGMLVGNRDYAELDRIYFRLLKISLAFVTLGVAAFVALVVLMGVGDVRFADRLLPIWPSAMLGLAMVLLIFPESQWTYIHAHKRSPHLPLAIFGAVVNGLLVWGLGRMYGSVGVAAAYLGMIALFYFPLWTAVWWRCRVDWHQDDSPGSFDDSDNQPGAATR